MYSTGRLAVVTVKGCRKDVMKMTQVCLVIGFPV
jgi:hypothetical protein